MNAFNFAKASSIGMKSRAVERQEAELGADGFDGRTHSGLFVDGEVIENDIAPAQRRDQDLIDLREEGERVDRAVEDSRRSILRRWYPRQSRIHAQRSGGRLRLSLRRWT
jgi:hypothetical protein